MIENYDPKKNYTSAIVRGFPEKEYHKITCCSQSKLKAFEKTAAHAKQALEFSKKVTPAMRLGSLVHCLTFTPDTFADQYYVHPDGFDLRSNARKDEHASACLQYGEDCVIKSDELQGATRLYNALIENDLFASILESADEKELSFFWVDPDTKAQCRGRADLVFTGTGLVLDLKTTGKGGSESEVFWQVYDRGYHVQAAFYLDGLKQLGIQADRFGFVFVETLDPFCVSYYELSQNFIAEGRALYKTYLERYTRAIQTDDWPGYPENFILLEPKKQF